ncbi:MAG: hypothetical protein IKY36_02775 [Bacteroidales bacterium]|nr:hypothetical protein [Bacteroidales bacterium]
MSTQELIMKLKSIPQVSECLDYMQTNSFLPVKKNFVEFSQDIYYAMFNTIVGMKKHYIVLPEVTEEWLVREILEFLEEKFKRTVEEKKKLCCVTEDSKEGLLEIADAIREICADKPFTSPMEMIAYVRELIDE